MSQKLNPWLPHGWQKSQILGHHPVPSRCIWKKLSWKWSGQDSNWQSYMGCSCVKHQLNPLGLLTLQWSMYCSGPKFSLLAFSQYGWNFFPLTDTCLSFTSIDWNSMVGVPGMAPSFSDSLEGLAELSSNTTVVFHSESIQNQGRGTKAQTFKSNPSLHCTGHADFSSRNDLRQHIGSAVIRQAPLCLEASIFTGVFFICVWLINHNSNVPHPQQASRCLPEITNLAHWYRLGQGSECEKTLLILGTF